MRSASELSIYLESSALVKRYAREMGSDFVLKLFREEGNVFYASRLVLVEISSGLARKKREKEIREEDYLFALADMEEDLQTSIAVIEVHEEILRGAALLVREYPPRAYDAVHLASAQWIRDKIKELEEKDSSIPVEFVILSSDERLIQAAFREGLQVIDPAKVETEERKGSQE